MIDIMSGGKCVAENIDPVVLEHRYGLPDRVISGILDALAGGTDATGVDVAGIGTVALSPVFLSRLAIDTIIEESGDDMTCREIAAALGITVNNVTQILDRAKRKMLAAGMLRDFLLASLELKRLRRGTEAEEYEINVETRVTMGW